MVIASIVWGVSGALLGLILNAVVLWLPTRMAEEDAFWLSNAREEHSKTAQYTSYFETLFSFKTERWLTWLVTLASMSAAVVLQHYFSSSLKAISWLVFFSTLIVLGAIDLKTNYLPDVLTIPLVWAGLIVQLSDHTRTVGPSMAILGAVGGYGVLWLLAKIYQYVRKRDGLGFGDLKLIAAIGAWLGPGPLPWIIFLASIFVVIFHSGQFLLMRKATCNRELAFGPWIIAATCVLFYTIFLR